MTGACGPGTQVIKDAHEHGAAVLAVPMKATVKESADGQFVKQTLDRSRLWEIHTPQVGEREGERERDGERERERERDPYAPGE
jgi:hypothetical protein